MPDRLVVAQLAVSTGTYIELIEVPDPKLIGKTKTIPQNRFVNFLYAVDMEGHVWQLVSEEVGWRRLTDTTVAP